VAAPADDGLVIREIWLLRLRALLIKAEGDQTNEEGRGDAMTAINLYTINLRAMPTFCSELLCSGVTSGDRQGAQPFGICRRR
jgi:hypothetical protein